MKIFEEYINNSFAGLPETPELTQIKQDMLANMEEKYEELLEAGLSAHEAIGSVIVDFGDVDELLVEMGYTSPVEEQPQEQVDFMPLSRIREYLQSSKETAVLIAAGVGLIILGVANANFIEAFNLFPNVTDQLPGILVLITVAISVGIFIYSSTRSPDFDDFNHWFMVKSDTRQIIEKEYQMEQRQSMRAIITGVMLLIISPVIILVADMFNSTIFEQMSTSIFLVIVSIGVFILVYAGMILNAYETVREKSKSVSEYYKASDAPPQNSERSDKFSSILWSLATIIYLAWSFTSNDWHITWIIFPITGLLQNILTTVFEE